MHILVAGNGFLGSEICRLLLANHCTLTVLRRSAAKSEQVEFVSTDLTQALPWNMPRRFDALIFCLAPDARNETMYRSTYITAQQNLVRAAEADRYIYISSTAVYPEGAGVYAEADAQAHTPRAAILLEAESLALTQHNATVLRLAGLYSGERRIYYGAPAADAQDRLVHLIHRDDAARAVIHALQQKLSGVFNVHDGNPQWRSAILRRLGFLKHDLSAGPTRQLNVQKFLSTGFAPQYADYYSGIGLA